MSIKKKLFLKFFVIALLFLFSFGGFRIFFENPGKVSAEDEDYLKLYNTAYKIYIDSDLNTAQAFALFHKKTEKIFNQKITKLVKYYNENKDVNKMKPIDTVCLFDENNNNFSTSCPSFLVKAEFEALKKAMDVRREKTEVSQCLNDTDFSEYKDHVIQVEESKAAYSIKRIGFDFENQKFDAKKKFIESELNFHARTIEIALKNFDEFSWSYPLHLQYEETIKLLKKFNCGLKKARRSMEAYRAKFENA